MALDTFLGRALMDPETGLPNLPYFCLIQNWEERRARRRKTQVRVLRLHVSGGDERVRRTLSWRLCQELRLSDLIASDSSSEFRILLTTPDAERAQAIGARIEEIGGAMNGENAAMEPICMRVEMEEPVAPGGDDKGPCDPCDEQQLRRAAEGTGNEWRP